jgi:hypothetical protein
MKACLFSVAVLECLSGCASGLAAGHRASRAFTLVPYRVTGTHLITQISYF